MPITFKIDKEKNIVYATILDNVDIEEHLSAMKKISSHPFFRPDINEIVDFTKCTDFLSGYDDMQKLLNVEDQSNPPEIKRKCAMIGKERGVYGMLRMYEIMTESKGIEVKFCDSIVDAENWILEK